MITANETQGKAKRQLVELARRLAATGKWGEAVAVNQQLIERSPRDVDAYNRLGKAYFELRRYRSAYEAYQSAVSIDPANIIAQRQLSRIEPLKDTESEDEVTPTENPVRLGVFIEEVGKTYVDDLVNVADSRVLTDLSSGERLQLESDGNAVRVVDRSGTYIGQLEPRIAKRIGEFLAMGNEYEVYVTASTDQSVRIIIREVHRSPEMGNRLSFPNQGKVAVPRAYLRDTRLFRDEPDMLLGEDEDDEGDVEEIDEFEALEDSEEEETEYVEETGTTTDEEEDEEI